MTTSSGVGGRGVSIESSDGLGGKGGPSEGSRAGSLLGASAPCCQLVVTGRIGDHGR